MSSLRSVLKWMGSLSTRIALFWRRRSVPPNRAIRGFLFFRSLLTSRQVLFPCSVSMVLRYLRSIAFTDDLCLAANVLSSDPRMIQCSFQSQQT